MEDLFALIVVICAVVSVLSKTAKKQQGKNWQKAHPVQHPAAPQAKPVAKAKSQAPERTAAPVDMMPERPTVRPTVHVTPHTPDMAEGSMHAVSTEGYDPCHEDQLTPAMDPCRAAPGEDGMEPAATGGLNLQWTGNELVRGMVMSEILNRPGQKRR